MKSPSTAAEAQALDAADPLSAFRRRFHLPAGPDGQPALYFCGNSLGLQPDTAASEVEKVLADWRQLAVLGHHGGGADWMLYQDALAPSLAALVGAVPAEVVTMNTLTINLHLMMASFYRPTRERHVVLMERGSFPSDRYAVCSQLAWHGLDPAASLVEVAPRAGEDLLRDEDLLAAIERAGPRLALVLLPAIQYLSGQLYDLPSLLRAARRQGAVAGLQLAHGIGNVPLALHDWDADFAVWCTYKYLNAGPGATAGAFVHERHFDAGLPRLAGWWGNDLATRFEFSPQFRPSPGAAGWQVSNGPILGMAGLKASLALFDEAGFPALVARSRRLTAFFERELLAAAGAGIELLTPRDPARRGAQLSVRIRGGRGEGRRLFDAIQARGLVCDWREPDVIRLAPVPLYNSYEDCRRAAELIGGLLSGAGASRN